MLVTEVTATATATTERERAEDGDGVRYPGDEDSPPPKALFSSSKPDCHSSEALDVTESTGSFGGDFIGVFQSYLRGDETVEVTRRRLVTRRHGENGAGAAALALKPKERDMKDQLWWIILRSLLLDLPLALLFASLIGAWLIREIHNEFYRPLIARARRTNVQLLQEFTYYERQCTQYDLSTRSIQELLVVDDGNNQNDDQTTLIHPTTAAVDQMLKHGAIVIPTVLAPATVTALRDFVVLKNQRITDAEAYPMSQGERRLSYGIDASEDPAVSAAIQEVANHPVLRPLLAALLGDDDPASAEITAITAYDGAEDQVWHQDTKQDGNAIKFARTYSHSYSLFLPLQDITEKMGATDICPGTHYCTNDLADMCEHTKMGLHLAGAGNVFPAGAGALLNQHVWHRGGAHTDPSAPERIVFILSFLARPNYDRDPRQLSRGTYFHQKWNMWGHTWKDLMSPATSMRHPFSLWRCLSLWKPVDANWGYDLITSGFMRFANEQLEYDDFGDRFLPRLDQIGFPEFLRGRHLSDTTQLETWTVFIKETIDNVYNFLRTANLYVHGAYLGFAFLWTVGWAFFQRKDSRGRSGGSLLRRATLRLTATHCLLLALGFGLWSAVRMSQWGQSISSGRALMRPFPTVDRITDAEASTVTMGLTTVPTRYDVLIGTRFDAEFLGSYNKWLDFHPGNAAYREATAKYASSFSASKTLGPVFSRSIVQMIIDEIKAQDGRFLQQDFRTGVWRVLTEVEVLETVAGDLVAQGNEAVAAVRTAADWMMALNRFGPRRGTPMARSTQLLLWNLKRRFLRVDTWLPPSPSNLTKKKSTLVNLRRRRSLPVTPKRASISRMLQLPRRLDLMPSAIKDRSEIKVGSLIWAWFEDSDEWFPGTVMSADDNLEWFDIAFEDSSWSDAIHISELHKFQAITEGVGVAGCFAKDGGPEDCFPGTVFRVFPCGHAYISFYDGDRLLLPPTQYYVPPYRYGGPIIL